MNKLILGILCLLSLYTIACSKTSNSGDTTSTAGTCSSGYLYSVYGCQLQCGTNAVWYNGQCVSTTTTTAVNTTTCASGYLYSSTYGCQQQCGTNMIWYNNSCISVTGTTTTTVSTGNMCQGVCAAGYTQTQGSCLPTLSCGQCYGYYQGYCYIGDYAHAYYGY